MMKQVLISLLFLLSQNLSAQESASEFDGHTWQAPYHLPIPKNWTIERFLIPISFAPQIMYNGVEDIRFTPGWGNSKSDEYWTYAFLWWLDGKVETHATMVAENLKNYYTGLIRVNTDSVTAANEKPIPVITGFKETEPGKNDHAAYSGSIQMTDYMQRKQIILNCIVHLKYCSETNKTIFFYQLSPKPFGHKNWANMDQLWSAFRCNKN